jgi:hypothetical protein
VTELPKIWLSIKEAAQVLGDTEENLGRQIREGKFPFKFERCGRRIKISAISLGVYIPKEIDLKEASASAAEAA